jgi:hypothetical protein
MINFENSELHNEATRTMTDAAVSAQTAYVTTFCAFEKIRESSRAEEEAREYDRFVTERASIKGNWFLN